MLKEVELFQELSNYLFYTNHSENNSIFPKVKKIIGNRCSQGLTVSYYLSFDDSLHIYNFYIWKKKFYSLILCIQYKKIKNNRINVVFFDRIDFVIF
jgi:hypothetical protein